MSVHLNEYRKDVDIFVYLSFWLEGYCKTKNCFIVIVEVHYVNKLHKDLKH